MHRKPSVFILASMLALGLLSACHALPPDASIREAKTTAAQSPVSAPADTVLTTPEPAPPYREYITLDEGYRFGEDTFYQGGVFGYRIYRLEDIYGGDAMYWEILVLKDNEVFAVLRQYPNEFCIPLPDMSLMVAEADADFDGQADVMICPGYSGTQAMLLYEAYLQRDGGFVHNPSFFDIPNPAVDCENQIILGSWRNWAASHSWAVYRYVNGVFVKTEELTEELSIPADEDEGEVWSWTETVNEDGEERIRLHFTDKDADYPELFAARIDGEDSYWNIGSPRWKPMSGN